MFIELALFELDAWLGFKLLDVVFCPVQLSVNSGDVAFVEDVAYLSGSFFAPCPSWQLADSPVDVVAANTSLL